MSVDMVDSEQVFGQHGGMIEQEFAPELAQELAEAGPMRLTGRGRLLVRFLGIVLVVVLFLLVAPGLARGDRPDRPPPRVIYVVEAGDTPWSIARRVAPGRDPRPVVDALIEANDLRGGLQAGQELSVPVPER